MAASLNASVPAYALLVLGLGLGTLVVLLGSAACYFYHKHRRSSERDVKQVLDDQYPVSPDVEEGSSKPHSAGTPTELGGPWPLDHSLADLAVASKPWAAAGAAVKAAGSTAGAVGAEVEVRTFVATDIEGSTALWERSVMDAAQEAHDTCLRMLLFKCSGEEVHTEGDAFCCAFESAVDAVVWCLMVQQALLSVDWPPELLQEQYAKEEAITDADGTSTVVFKGLRIRMGVHTSAAFSLAPHPVTGQQMYRGSAPEFADKLCGMGKGGQILLCGHTYQLICKRLGEIAAVVDSLQQEQAGVQLPPASQRLNSSNQLPDYLHLCRGSNCSTPLSSQHHSAPGTPSHASRPGSAPLDPPPFDALLNGGPALSFNDHMHHRPPRFIPLPPLHSNTSAIPLDAPTPDPAPFPDPSLPYAPPPAAATPRARSPLRHPQSPHALLQDSDDESFGLSASTLRERSFDVRTKVQRSSPSAVMATKSPRLGSPLHPTAHRCSSSGNLAAMLMQPAEAAGGVDEGEAGMGVQPGGLSLAAALVGGHRRPGSASSRHSVDGLLPPSNGAFPPTPMLLSRTSQTHYPTQPLLQGRPGEYRLSNSLTTAPYDLSNSFDTRFSSINSDLFASRAGSKVHRLVSDMITDGAPSAYASLPLLVDMGKHALQWGSSKSSKSDDQRPAATHIVMVVSSALRGRLQFWPGPLDSKQQQDAGYFDAPYTLSTAKWVGSNIAPGSRPFVTFGFCSICPETAGRLPEDKLDVVTEAFTQVVRSTLRLCGGYECQERGGTFMLAFERMRYALEWSLTFQLALMQVDWALVVGEEGRACLQELLGHDGRVVFRGLKGRVGLMHGEVVKVTPHATTGRADYFGPVLNRAARVHSASHGGQVLAEAFATYKAVREWQGAYNQAEDVATLTDTHPLLNEPLGPVGPKMLAQIKKKLQYSRSIAQHNTKWNPAEATSNSRGVRPGRSFSARDTNLPLASSLNRTLQKQSSWGSEGRSEPVAPMLAGAPLVPRQRLAVHVYDRGTYQFKGVDIFIPTVSVLPADLDQREGLFPIKPLSSKAKLAKQGSAPMQRVFVELPDVSQVELLRPALASASSSDQMVQGAACSGQ